MLSVHNLVSQWHTGHLLQALQDWTCAQEVGGHLQVRRAGEPIWPQQADDVDTVLGEHFQLLLHAAG